MRLWSEVFFTIYLKDWWLFFSGMLMFQIKIGVKGSLVWKPELNNTTNTKEHIYTMITCVYNNRVCVCVRFSLSVVSNSMRPHGPIRLLCPWNSPGKNTGVSCHSLLQGIFLTQGLNPGLLHCRQILYCLSHQGNQLYTSTIRVYNFLPSELKIRAKHAWIMVSCNSALW